MATAEFFGFVIEFWALLFADWRREYHTDIRDDLDAGMPAWDFTALVAGLSAECRFWNAVQRKPVGVSTPEAIAAMTGRYLGPPAVATGKEAPI